MVSWRRRGLRGEIDRLDATADRLAAVTEDAQDLVISVTDPREGVYVVALAGDLDLASAAALLPRVSQLPTSASATVVVDVAGVSFMDSSGLNALIACARAVESGGGQLLVSGASEHLTRVFEVVHLAESVAVVPSLEAALNGAERGDPTGDIRP
jgi:anti-anti-sigma factor